MSDQARKDLDSKIGVLRLAIRLNEQYLNSLLPNADERLEKMIFIQGQLAKLRKLRAQRVALGFQ